MTGWRRLPVCIGALVAMGAATAQAAGPEHSNVPAQLVGLFMQSCMRFVGDAAALREWAVHSGLQPLPAAGQQAFLYGLPGEVFDASTQAGKLVLISENGGSCSAMAEAANGTEVVQDLEQVMRAAHVTFTMTHEDDDTEEKVLHHREYVASQGSHQWQMLVSTVRGTASGEAMLTTNP